METSFATPNIGESLPAVFVSEKTGAPFVPQVTFFFEISATISYFALYI
jgi:hypothetical protein